MHIGISLTIIPPVSGSKLGAGGNREAEEKKKDSQGVIITNPAIAPINVESNDHLPSSQYVIPAHVSAPADAHTLVTHSAMTLLKFSASVVPASKASHELQMTISASSWHMLLCGRCSARCEGVRVADLRDRKSG